MNFLLNYDIASFTQEHLEEGSTVLESVTCAVWHIACSPPHVPKLTEQDCAIVLLNLLDHPSDRVSGTLRALPLMFRSSLKLNRNAFWFCSTSLTIPVIGLAMLVIGLANTHPTDRVSHASDRVSQ